MLLVGALGLWHAGVAQAGWSAPVGVSVLGHLATYPAVGSDGQGDAVAVWMDVKGRTGYDRIMASQRLASAGVWSRPVALSPRGRFGGFPEIAVDRSGGAVAVWQEGGVSQGKRKPGLPFIEASFKRSPTGRWSRRVRISARGLDSENPQVAVNSSGQAAAIWVTTARHHESMIEVSMMNVARGVWSAPVVLERASKLMIWPQITVSRSGEAFAVWKRYIRHTGRGFEGATQWWIGAGVKPAHRHSWLIRDKLGREEEPVLQGDTATEQPGPHIAADAHGHAIAVWQGGRTSHLLAKFAVWKARSRDWSKPTAVSQAAAIWPQVASSPSGDATVVWEGASDSIFATRRRIWGCCWSAAQRIGSATPPSFAPDLLVEMDPRGDALASWTGGHPQVALRLGPTGSWRAPVALTASSNGANGDSAMTSRNRAVVVWQQPTSHPRGIQVEAAVYNGSP